MEKRTPGAERNMPKLVEHPALASPGLQRVLEGLPRGLYAHVQQVRATARELAAPLGLDPALVDLAASAHDIARVVKGPRLLAEARRRGIRIDRVESALPVLLHGPVGAARLRRDLGVTEPQVLEAVHWHSTAAPGLGLIARVVYLADKLDPTKASRYPFMEAVRDLALRDLDGAVELFPDQGPPAAASRRGAGASGLRRGPQRPAGRARGARGRVAG